MAVTKRTRFEVLRRDDYTCRYCRSTDNPLTVDHVVPVSLGGADDPSNLVAACRDCNAGKSSSSPDAEMVAQVSEDALEYARLTREAYAVLAQTIEDKRDYIEVFQDHYTYTPMPDDWAVSVGRWYSMGVPIEIVTDAADTACALTQTFRGDGRFKYMCGIVWNQVRLARDDIAARDALDGAYLTVDDLDELSMDGWRRGRRTAEVRCARRHGLDEILTRTIDHHPLSSRFQLPLDARLPAVA